MLGILKKPPCWKRLIFSENFPIGKIISLCVGPVLWFVGTLSFFKVPLCVGPVLWCVGTLSFFKVPCAWAMCCGLVVCEDFEFFLSSPVCGPCAVVCGDFEFFKVPLCVKLYPCTGEIEFLQKKIPVLGIFPCAGEIGFFRSKSPVVAQ